jgi:hypothetical protein
MAKKNYKNFKKKYDKKSKGVGDTVEKITTATGIKKITKWLAGEDCGCEERKQKLNYLFPYNQPLCFTEDEYNYVTEKIDNKTITPDEQIQILTIYNRVFKENVSTTSCSSCFVNNVWNKLKRIYKEYQDDEV